MLEKGSHEVGRLVRRLVLAAACGAGERVRL